MKTNLKNKIKNVYMRKIFNEGKVIFILCKRFVYVSQYFKKIFE